jgi:hypothetical protein
VRRALALLPVRRLLVGFHHQADMVRTGRWSATCGGRSGGVPVKSQAVRTTRAPGLRMRAISARAAAFRGAKCRVSTLIAPSSETVSTPVAWRSPT